MAGSRFNSPNGLVWALACTLCLCALSPAARAEQVTLKHGRFLEHDRRILVTVGFREMFTPRLKGRLRSGFATTVVMRIYLYSKKDSQPVSVAVRTLKAVYDLWEERYILRMRDHRGTRFVRLNNEKRVVDRLTSLWRFPVASFDQIRPNQKYFIAVIAEVNPVSEELLAEVRRWLRSPHGHRNVGGESFFGSFVSIFINNKIRRAERSFRLRTQPFYRRP